MILKATVEIPMGSKYKFERSKYTGQLTLDRVINQRIPFSYGYFPNTLCADGDPLDVFVVSEDPIPSLTEVPIKLVGVFRCKDNGVQDDKILGLVVGDDCALWGAQALIEMYLRTYKEGFIVEQFGNIEEAMHVYNESRAILDPQYIQSNQ